MRAIPVLVILGLLSVAAPAALAHGGTYYFSYQANPVDWFGFPRIFSQGPSGYNLGGALVVVDTHASVATITIVDDLNGPIAGLVCQDIDNSGFCDTTKPRATVGCAAGQDCWDCVPASTGTLAGFPVAARGANPRDKLVGVYVSSYLWHVEGCGGPGEATTGVIGYVWS